MDSRVWGRALALWVLLVGAMGAGCVSEDDPDATPLSNDGIDTAPPTTTPGVNDTVLEQIEKGNELLFAPEWEVGWWWTFEAEGSLLDQSYTATIGVTDDSGSTYAIGSAGDEELMTQAATGSSLFLGGIQKDTLAVDQEDSFQDLLGFRRGVGASWEATLHGQPVTLTKGDLREVSSAVGTGRGIVVTGTSVREDAMRIEYNAEAEIFTLVEWTDAEEVLLRFRLVERGLADPPQLRTWEITDQGVGAASGSPNHVGGNIWQSDGSGDHLFLRIHADNQTLGYGTILDPMGQQRLEAQSDESARAVGLAIVDDQQGAWTMLGFNTGEGTRVDLQVFQLLVVMGAPMEPS